METKIKIQKQNNKMIKKLTKNLCSQDLYPDYAMALN